MIYGSLHLTGCDGFLADLTFKFVGQFSILFRLESLSLRVAEDEILSLVAIAAWRFCSSMKYIKRVPTLLRIPIRGKGPIGKDLRRSYLTL